jgi:hypothetical protein
MIIFVLRRRMALGLFGWLMGYRSSSNLTTVQPVVALL